MTERTMLPEDLLLSILRSERVKRGLTQAAVAERMGVSQKQVSAIETGDLKAMQVRTLSRYVEALGGELIVEFHFPDR